MLVVKFIFFKDDFVSYRCIVLFRRKFIVFVEFFWFFGFDFYLVCFGSFFFFIWWDFFLIRGIVFRSRWGEL